MEAEMMDSEEEWLETQAEGSGPNQESKRKGKPMLRQWLVSLSSKDG